MLLPALTFLLLFVCLGLAAYLWLVVRRQAVFSREVVSEADRRFATWKEQEIEGLRVQLLDLARKEAAVQLEAWKIESTAALRQDAILKSQSVTLGKVSENIAPYMPDFQWNPRDARFIESPIDFVVFDGLDDGIVQEVIFLEIKTATSGLSTRQRQIRDAVVAGRVSWQEMRIG